ncbi:MAG TPA: TA system VapC family ribonuclease toxin [Edaphobacter sp.]|nr:TA system VapC family ribonuclease toxin [Edaphobacter sp.]
MSGWHCLLQSTFIHLEAKRWFASLTDDEELVFCRFTQLGLLRLLTTGIVMGDDVRTQRQAWRIYDTFLADGGARFMHEPRTLEESFRKLSRSVSASPKEWADSYLTSFAIETGATLVTFDKALAARTSGSILLKPKTSSI